MKLGSLIRKTTQGREKEDASVPVVEAVATLVMKDDSILAVFNEKWGAFTLPMTKPRMARDPVVGEDPVRVEEDDEAALRAAGEWLGRTLRGMPEFLTEIAEFQQSDRDGQWKRYRTKIFRINVDAETAAPTARVTEWLTADGFVDRERGPISPTARHLVEELRLQDIV